MSFLEGAVEILGDFITEVIIKHLLYPFFKHIGASLKWIFLFSKFSYWEIYDRPRNAALGITFVCVTLSITLAFFSFRHSDG